MRCGEVGARVAALAVLLDLGSELVHRRGVAVRERRFRIGLSKFKEEGLQWVRKKNQQSGTWPRLTSARDLLDIVQDWR